MKLNVILLSCIFSSSIFFNSCLSIPVAGEPKMHECYEKWNNAIIQRKRHTVAQGVNATITMIRYMFTGTIETQYLSNLMLKEGLIFSVTLWLLFEPFITMDTLYVKDKANHCNIDSSDYVR